MAERAGFEPARNLRLYAISSRARSSTPAPLQQGAEIPPEGWAFTGQPPGRRRPIIVSCLGQWKAPGSGSCPTDRFPTQSLGPIIEFGPKRGARPPARPRDGLLHYTQE